MTNTNTVFHVPTRPYSPIDAHNRSAAALGSPRYGQLTAHANYNGHRVSVVWNDYRRYYIARYMWSGPRVLARGTFSQCFEAAMREHGRGALGASVSLLPREDDAEAIALCESAEGVLPGALRDEDRSWYTWRHEIGAMSPRDYANPGMSRIVFDWPLLEAAESREVYEAAVIEKYGRLYC